MTPDSAQSLSVATTNPPSTPQTTEAALDKKLQEISLKNQSDASAKRATDLGLAFSGFQGVAIDPEALAILDEATARSSNAVVVYRAGQSIIVAVLDPENPRTKETLANLERSNYSLKLVLTSPDALGKILDRYSSLQTTATFETGMIDIQPDTLTEIQNQIETISDLKSRLLSGSTSQLLEVLIAGALKTKASDIHLEPQAQQARLRYRLDGLLQDIATLEKPVSEKLLNRVKVLARLKLNLHQNAQDGRFTIHQADIDIEVRVSILPSEFGETIVMRLLDPRSIKASLESLGMRPELLKIVQMELRRPNGAIMTTGPTGSGKTTTLYAFATHLNSSDTKIITIEDPIEYRIEGVSQTQVEPSKGYDFASGLRAIVRQDPDVILVGEIRDQETAAIALNAALTGHMVLTTLHTNDAAGAIPRLIDLGIKPPVIAPALRLVIAQRLIRRLCDHCKVATSLSPETRGHIENVLAPLRPHMTVPAVTDQTEVFEPGQCDQCNGFGYQGRLGVFEAFQITPEIEKLILASPSISAVRDAAIAQGMITLLQDAYLRLLAGETSYSEIERVVGIT